MNIIEVVLFVTAVARGITLGIWKTSLRHEESGRAASSYFLYEWRAAVALLAILFSPMFLTTGISTAPEL